MSVDRCEVHDSQAAFEAPVPVCALDPTEGLTGREDTDRVAPMVLHTRVVSETGGGPEKTILNSPRFLQPYGFRAKCAYMYPAGDPGFETIRAKAEQYGAPLEAIEDRGPIDLRVVKRLLDLCRRERVAIWHGHDYKSNAIGLLIKRFHPMKILATTHGWVKFTRRTPLYYKIDKICLRRMDHVLCVSGDLQEICLANRVKPERCTLIENAIDTDQFARRWTQAEAKRHLGLDPERLLVGCVGRLSEEKNFAGLIIACDRLIRDGMALDLVIVGEGDQRESLQRQISELGREKEIRLLGYRGDTIDLYQAMDVFVLSSLREGLPNVVLEAMSLETPVLATRIAGVPKLIEHEQSGLLIEPGQIDPIETELRRLLETPRLRETLARQGRKTIEDNYSFARRMEKVRAIYRKLLEEDA